MPALLAEPPPPATHRVPYGKRLEAIVAAARVNFTAFVLLMCPVDSGYVLGPLHRYLAQLMQDIADGREGKRTTVSVPPQHGKTSLLTVLGAAWLMGRYPGIACAITGAVGSLLTDFSKRVRSLVNDPRYRWVFPGTELVFGSNRSDHWRMTNHSELVARAAGSKLIGRRVDWLIIDDPHKGREEAESPLQRARVLEWYFADCYTRLAPNAKVLIVATRWHTEDLIGHLTGGVYVDEMKLRGQPQEIYRRIVIEALCEHPENDPLNRQLGEALSPELGRGVAFLEGTRAALPAYEWSSQYQGNPKGRQGDAADTSQLRVCGLEDVPKSVTWLRGWDLALTEKEASDFTAGAMCGLDEETGDFYVADMWRDKKAWAKLKPRIIATSLNDRDEYGAHRIGVEVVGAFDIGWSELRDAPELLGEIKVSKSISSKSKLVRAQPWLNKLEKRRLWLVRGPWIAAFKEELEAFPAGAHDDQIDAVSVAYVLLNRKGFHVV